MSQTEQVQPKKRGRPPKQTTQITTEINSTQQIQDTSYEVSSYNSVFVNIFGSSFFNSYDINTVTQYVENPMLYNREVRGLSNFAYNAYCSCFSCNLRTCVDDS